MTQLLHAPPYNIVLIRVIFKKLGQHLKAETLKYLYCLTSLIARIIFLIKSNSLQSLKGGCIRSGPSYTFQSLSPPSFFSSHTGLVVSSGMRPRYLCFRPDPLTSLSLTTCSYFLHNISTI